VRLEVGNALGFFGALGMGVGELVGGLGVGKRVGAGIGMVGEIVTSAAGWMVGLPGYLGGKGIWSPKGRDGRGVN
jgi:hypothetical protein